MCLIEASWLVQLIFGDPQIFTLQILLARLHFCRIYGSVFLQFSGSWPNQGLSFSEIKPPKKFDPGLNRCTPGRHKFLCKQIFQIPKFAETLIYFGEKGEAVSPCESCPNQVISDTMLIFHMLDQIHLYSIQNHNSNISRITDRNTITRQTQHLSWETFKEKKTQQNFLCIRCIKYNPKNRCSPPFALSLSLSLSLSLMCYSIE